MPDRRRFFARVTGAALGAVAAKVGLDRLPGGGQPYGVFWKRAGINVLHGGWAPRSDFVTDGRFDMAKWRMRADSQKLCGALDFHVQQWAR